MHIGTVAQLTLAVSTLKYWSGTIITSLQLRSFQEWESTGIVCVMKLRLICIQVQFLHQLVCTLHSSYITQSRFDTQQKMHMHYLTCKLWQQLTRLSSFTWHSWDSRKQLTFHTTLTHAFKSCMALNTYVKNLRACAQGIKKWVCLSVIVTIVLTKITKSTMKLWGIKLLEYKKWFEMLDSITLNRT